MKSRAVTQAAVTIAAALISHCWILLPVRSVAVRHSSGLASFGHRLWLTCLSAPLNPVDTGDGCESRVRRKEEYARKQQRKEAKWWKYLPNRSYCWNIICCSVWRRHAYLVVMLSTALFCSAPRSHHYLLRVLEKPTFCSQCSLYIRPP